VKITVLKNDLKNDLLTNDLLKNDVPTSIAGPSEWQTYRTRFTIRARILSAPLSFVDALGREQNGKRGDYLVESNGMVTITPRHIFEDVYVTLDPIQNHLGTAALGCPAEGSSASSPRKSPISTTKRGYFPASRRRSV
jgi:hypothetical protein